jgi:hypothetical protein
MILRVYLRNEIEWDMTEKLLFLLGYVWCSAFNRFEHIIFNPRNCYISVWKDGELKYGSRPNYYDNGQPDITFEKFIDYLEQNDIKVGEPNEVSLKTHPGLRYDEIGNIIPVKDEYGGVYSSAWGTYM